MGTNGEKLTRKKKKKRKFKGVISSFGLSKRRKKSKKKEELSQNRGYSLPKTPKASLWGSQQLSEFSRLLNFELPRNEVNCQYPSFIKGEEEI